MFQRMKLVMMASLGISLWSGLVRAQHLEVKGNASVATGDETAGLAVGVPPAERKAKVHIKAPGYSLGENPDGTSAGEAIPLLLQPEAGPSVLGALNQHGRATFAVNLEGDNGTTNDRGFPVFYDAFDGMWRPSLYVLGGSVGIGRKPQDRLDVLGNIKAKGWLITEGPTGWYSQTYGGGFLMTDTYWIRTHNNNGIWAGAGYLGSNGGLTIGFGGYAPPPGGGAFDGSVGIGTREPAHKLDVHGDIGVFGVSAILRDGTNAVLFPWGTGYASSTVHVGGYAVTNLEVHGRITAAEGVKVYRVAYGCDGGGQLSTEAACQKCSEFGGEGLCAGNWNWVPNTYLGKLVD